MENENVKVHPVKRFFKVVGKALPDVLMFAAIYFLVFMLFYGMATALKTDTKADVLAAENEYLKGQIEWYQAQLADEPYIPAPAITEGEPDE